MPCQCHVYCVSLRYYREEDLKPAKWYEKVQEKTEKFLTWRKRRKLIKREKQRRKNPIADWTEVIVSAVFIVLLINQYLFQAYQIPTGSMEHTLDINDRIFVNKFIYGPELIPGQAKLDGFVQPKRGDIIIFESPEYFSKGPYFEILYRVLYMITFTFVNLDRNEDGSIAHHFLIKRAIGMPHDRIRIRNGNVEILPPGEMNWVLEKEMQERLKLTYPVNRLIPAENYKAFKEITEENIPNGKSVVNVLQEIARRGMVYYDRLFVTKEASKLRYEMNPHNKSFSTEWKRKELGWYIAEDRVFPMGDNRDNSRDARYFNPVLLKKVLGQASFRFWPFNRFGGIN